MSVVGLLPTRCNVTQCSFERVETIRVRTIQYAIKNKKAQLSLGKTRYISYSSCCNADLKNHPRWMIFMLFESQYATSY